MRLPPRPAPFAAAATAGGRGEAKDEIVPCTPTVATPAHVSEEEESGEDEDDEILCSVCPGAF